MDKVTLGRTGLEVPKFGVGGAWCAIDPDGQERSRKLIHRAMEFGMNYIDTAAGYGDSEEAIGKVIKDISEPIIISTKLGGRPDPFEPQNIDCLRKSVETSLKLLHREQIDILMIHEPDRPGEYDWWADRDTFTGPVTDLLAELKEKEIIRFTGLGGTTAYEIAPIIRTGQFDVVLTAFNYSLLWREAEIEVFPACKEVGAGIVAALMAAFLLIHADAMVGLIAAVGLLGFVVAGVGVNRYHRAAMPVPDAKRPLTTVAIDRTHCDALLSKSGFIKATPEGFGIFEQWVLKLGYFLSRRSGDDLFDSELIVFMHPHKSVTSEFVRRLEEYVREGGHVLVLDSGLNQKSTACSLLQPFGLSLDRYAEQLDGALNLPEGWPVVGVAEALPVEGGTPFAKIGDKTVGSVARHGKGSAVYVGFGSRFGDDNMGISTDIEPTPEMRQVFEVEFRLLRAIIERTLPEAEK